MKGAFRNVELARLAGSKGGKAVEASKRYFSINREAARAAAKKGNTTRSRKAIPPLPESISAEEFELLKRLMGNT